MTHDEMIAVIQAHKDGKTIQYKVGEDMDWLNIPHQKFNFGGYDYRVKPEPMVRYAVVGNLGHTKDHVFVYDTNKSDAEYYVRISANPNLRLVKFVEEL